MQEQCFLLANYQAYLEQMKPRIEVDRTLKTFKLRTYQLSLLREYVKKQYKLKDIALTQLDKAFIEDFEYYLTIERGLKQSSIASTLSVLQSIVLQAVRRGYLELNPFIGIAMSVLKASPKALPRQSYKPSSPWR